MTVARLPVGQGLVCMEKSHCREYCPSVGLIQVILWTGEGGVGTCRLHRHTAYTQPLVLPWNVNTHVQCMVPLVHCQAACYDFVYIYYYIYHFSKNCTSIGIWYILYTIVCMVTTPCAHWVYIIRVKTTKAALLCTCSKNSHVLAYESDLRCVSIHSLLI